MGWREPKVQYDTEQMYLSNKLPDLILCKEIIPLSSLAGWATREIKLSNYGTWRLQVRLGEDGAVASSIWCDNFAAWLGEECTSVMSRTKINEKKTSLWRKQFLNFGLSFVCWGFWPPAEVIPELARHTFYSVESVWYFCRICYMKRGRGKARLHRCIVERPRVSTVNVLWCRRWTDWALRWREGGQGHSREGRTVARLCKVGRRQCGMEGCRRSWGVGIVQQYYWSNLHVHSTINVEPVESWFLNLRNSNTCTGRYMLLLLGSWPTETKTLLECKRKIIYKK